MPAESQCHGHLTAARHSRSLHLCEQQSKSHLCTSAVAAMPGEWKGSSGGFAGAAELVWTAMQRKQPQKHGPSLTHTFSTHPSLPFNMGWVRELDTPGMGLVTITTMQHAQSCIIGKVHGCILL